MATDLTKQCLIQEEFKLNDTEGKSITSSPIELQRILSQRLKWSTRSDGVIRLDFQVGSTPNDYKSQYYNLNQLSNRGGLLGAITTFYNSKATDEILQIMSGYKSGNPNVVKYNNLRGKVRPQTKIYTLLDKKYLDLVCSKPYPGTLNPIPGTYDVKIRRARN